MTHRAFGAARLSLTAALMCGAAMTQAHAEAFNRIASFPVNLNLPEGAEALTETSAEIIDVTADGMTLIYTDSPLGVVGMVDISDPANPQPRGAIMVDGEPTGVAVVGQTAFAGVNTSESYVAPSGYLAVIDVATGALTKSCDLSGQPDSVAAAKDGSFLAVAVENERDEDLNDGEIPQLPAGHVAIVPLTGGAPDCAAMVLADVTGLSAIAPSDPEPEFVDINGLGEIVVTLQENNHLVVLDRTGAVLSHFSAGAVDLENVDTEEEGALTFDGALQAVAREPDSVKWLDDDRFVTANEGDYNGGSRGFTIWSKTGEVLYDSGLSFEYAVAQAGHYPEERSGNKGAEPEGLEVDVFNGATHIFVMSERGSLIGVYADGETPELLQLLPSGIAPEGGVAVPSRGLFVTANEADLGEDGAARSHVMIYQLQDAEPAYPTLVSGMDEAGRPVGWGAISGMVADAETPGRIYAVNDSFYAMQPTIFEIDATQKPARIVRAIRVTREGQPAQKLDLEGVTLDGNGGFWLASEGRSDRLIPHALYHVDAKGEIRREIAFPPELLAGETRFGAEGVTMVGDTLWIAIQREWKDDPKGFVKLLAYDTKSKEWGAVRYPLETPGTGWMGLSEITAHGDAVYIVERDNQIGANAAVKRLYSVPLAQMTPAPLGGELPVVEKTLVRDFIPDLASWGGYIVDKVEGFAIDADGVGYVSTDNDGVDDSSGETFFWSIGPVAGN
ncbi:esterase-like activity of phytase family protein [Rubrimonas cliftonensis]|uniref:Esterase-like activity of phytase n=1 Tax=Rubrimonas cliftonensis TaxID=89524 RepID=A0A1H3Z3U6_9RHOB|nr:esterase-like activity of phytase family protein [Rubrimonas cliftonensis]SEA18513.1 Esterase-like activity of phytase [Rubrimonas cliftonensis]